MSEPLRRAAVALPAVAGALLLATGVAAGALAVAVALPVSGAAAWLAWRSARRVHARTPRRLVGLGGVVVLAALAFALAAPALLVGLALAAGIGSAALGARLSLAMETPPPGAAIEPSAALDAAVAADLLLTSAWEIAALVRPRGELPRMAREVHTALERYAERGWLDEPSRAFPTPPPLEKPLATARVLRGFGAVEHLRFESAFEPAESEIAAGWARERANRTAHALLWRHRSESPRPALVVVHGFGMGRPDVDPHWLRLRGLDLGALHRRLGVDVAYLVLPLHGPRGSTWPSGAGFFGEHPLTTNAALGQAVWDLRRLAGWLRAEGSPAVGVLGLSLGGTVSALFASLDPQLACAVPVIPAVDLAALFWRHLPGLRRREWRAAGLDAGTLGRAWSLHAPLRHRPRVPAAGRLLVAAAADRITVPSQALALWEHWERPALHWFPGAHLAWRGRADLVRRLEGHLEGTLLRETDGPPALSRFRAG